ncbi:MAG TPA: efflux RND transporter periplasmic adaptor subunit [Solirubrobacteraceae bacterium]|nr:efflux RND transporter periplasmic adaptor subunit [Solirubrobacteraceae bacterium]
MKQAVMRKAGACGIFAAALLAMPAAGFARSFECLIQPVQMVEIRSPTEGLIRKVYVQRGDSLKAGQVLVELESSAERSAVAGAKYRSQMQGRLAAARERVEYASKKLNRARELQKQHFVAAQARDDAQAELRVAESELQDARENRELARLEYQHALDLLNLRSLHSPFDGVVMDRILNPGDLAQGGTDSKPILKIAQINPLRVEVVLPGEYFGKLRQGMSGEVSPEGLAGRHGAKITVIDRVFDAASGTFGVRLELPNPDASIPGGVRCRVEFPQLQAPGGPGRAPLTTPG